MRIRFFQAFFITGMLMAAAMPVSAQTTTPPIGFWRLNENTGNEVNNLGTAGGIGYLSNMATTSSATSGWNPSSISGAGLNFDGLNDVINLEYPTVFNDMFTHDATISAWINPISCNSLRHIGGKATGGPIGFYLYASNGSCNPRIDVHHSGTRATYISSANSIAPNQWNHVTYVWKANTKTAKIYVNGVEVSYTHQIPGSGTYSSDALAKLTFGNWHHSAGATFFQGGMDEIKIYDYARTPAQILVDFANATPSLQPVTVVREASSLLARVQVPDAAEGTYAEYKFKKVAKGVWNIQGLRIVDVTGLSAPRILNNTASVWEYAGFLGVAGDPPSPAINWGDFGSGHGDENVTSAVIKVDGIDITALPVGASRDGSVLTIEQAMDTLYPKDPTIVVGTTTLAHTLDANGLTVDQTHAYVPGYELYNFYTALLPTTGALDGSGMNRAQIGTSTPRVLKYDGTVYDLNTIADSAIMYSTEHPYAIKMTLPFGGPNVNGDWSNDRGAEKMWLYDTASGYAKVYTNWISGGYPNRVPAQYSEHQTHYSVYLRP